MTQQARFRAALRKQYQTTMMIIISLHSTRQYLLIDAEVSTDCYLRQIIEQSAQPSLLIERLSPLNLSKIWTLSHSFIIYLLFRPYQIRIYRLYLLSTDLNYYFLWFCTHWGPFQPIYFSASLASPFNFCSSFQLDSWKRNE